MGVLKKGKEVIDIQVENALLKRALGYRYTEITKERIADTGQKKRHNGESELTSYDWEVCQKYFGGICAYCGSTGKLTKDHLDPLANGGKLISSNIIPVCQSCNSSKNDNQWLGWYQKQSFYDKYKAQKIMDYVDFILHVSNKTNTKETNLVVTKEITKEVVPDVVAAFIWLKNRRLDKRRDKPEGKSNSQNIEDIAKNTSDLAEILFTICDNMSVSDEKPKKVISTYDKTSI